MTILFNCPSCKANYEVSDDLGGKMILCRVCQKRGTVKSGSAAATPAGTKATSSGPSRRNFLLMGGGVVASLGAIATGAILARQPWVRWREEAEATQEGSGRRRRNGPPPGGPPPENPPPPPPT